MKFMPFSVIFGKTVKMPELNADFIGGLESFDKTGNSGHFGHFILDKTRKINAFCALIKKVPNSIPSKVSKSSVFQA